MKETIKKNILKSIRKVEFKTNVLVDTLMAGLYRSIFLGGGVDFSELRHYSPGDDVRFIDWKVSRKHRELYVKQFVEERESVFHFIVDLTKSMYLENKLEYAILLFASFMFYAARSANGFYLTTFGKKIKFHGRFRTTKDCYFLLGQVIDLILEDNADEIELSDVLKRVRVKSTHTLVFSDFMFNDFENELQRYSRYTLDFIGFQVLSNSELNPSRGAFSLNKTKIVSTPNDLKYFIESKLDSLKRLFAKFHYHFYTFDSSIPLEINLRKLVNE